VEELEELDKLNFEINQTLKSSKAKQKAHEEYLEELSTIIKKAVA
jgi:hypothetical protein